jgi:hypothetical protein
MSTRIKTDHELIETVGVDSAGGLRSEPGGERSDLPALRACRRARRSGCRARFATVLLTR